MSDGFQMDFRVHADPDLNFDKLVTLFLTDNDQRADPRPLKEIFSHIIHSGCKTVVEERDYIDNDFLSEYESFYSRNFKNVPKYCTRLHFFSTILNEDDLFSLNQEKFERSYLGFCVLRPTSVYRVGRTILIPPASNDDFFILCKAVFHSHIMGKRFEVETMPFMQQDTSVGACAQACLWMTTRYMHKKHLLPKYLPYQITDFATRSISMGSVMPNRKGISQIQMLEALRLVGLQCVFDRFAEGALNPQQEKEKISAVKRFIYPYLESELPVILNLQFPDRKIGHAVVLVGHTFARNDTPERHRVLLAGNPVNILSNVSWVPAFIIQDDSRGPFLKIEDMPNDGTGISLGKVASAIAALPAEVSMFAEEVETNAVAMMKVLLEGGVEKTATLDDFVFRTYLRESNLFKKDLCNDQRGFSNELKKHYRKLPMPKYVWITEISNKEYMNKKIAAERKVLGEFICDSTANPHEKDDSFLAFRFKKFFCVQNVDKREWKFLKLQDENPCIGLARTAVAAV